MMNIVDRNIEIGKLYDELISSGKKTIIYKDGYELIPCDDIEIQTYGNKYVNVICLSRHKTAKKLVKLTITSDNKEYSIIVTTDHICMIYNRDHFFENADAKSLKINDYVSVYDEKEDVEKVGIITKIEDLGKTDEYVYDVQVEDDMHSFYANDILIHNSFFLDLYPITNWMRNKYGLSDKIREWPDDKKKELWDIMVKFTEEKLNPFVRNLVHDYCKTNQQNVLTYECEYMNAMLIMEGKKHYLGHKIFEEGDMVDKLKITGIELKKNILDKSMKSILKDCYYGIIYHDWTEKQYKDYISEKYKEFKTYDIDQISFWKGYNSAREASGFLTMSVGTTGIAKAATYYNQIIDKLKLGKKYDQINVGDKCRFCYIQASNKYGIDCIAYKPGQWPSEFNDIFQIDYKKMFDKLILDSLKRYREACMFQEFDPSKEVVYDIFDL